MDLSKLVILPGALQIVVDDVGWFFGNDDRYKGGPSRSVMPRRHRPDDYAALERLGRALHMKITCALVIGEWDSKNILKGVPGATRYGDDWDNARFFKEREARDCIDVIKNSTHIEFALHGLLHWYWEKSNSPYPEFYYLDSDNKLKMPPREHLLKHIDAFFEIYNQWGFNGPIRAFLPPCFSYQFDKSASGLSRILSQYGILYTIAPFDMMGACGQKPVLCDVENSIITVDRTSDLCCWYKYDTSPDFNYFKDGIFGFHWVNFLKLIPQNNSMVVDKWIEYFRLAGKRFGTVLSKDIAFAASQALYKRYAKLIFEKDTVIIDLKEALAMGAKGLLNKLYISIKNEAVITEAKGCAAVPFEYQSTFTTYQLDIKDSLIKLKISSI